MPDRCPHCGSVTVPRPEAGDPFEGLLRDLRQLRWMLAVCIVLEMIVFVLIP